MDWVGHIFHRSALLIAGQSWKTEEDIIRVDVYGMLARCCQTAIRAVTINLHG